MITSYLIDPDIERANKRGSAAIALGILATAIVIFILWKIPRASETSAIDFIGGGVEVQFGYTDYGFGPEEPSPKPITAEAAAAEPSEASEDPIKTYDNVGEDNVGSSKPKTTTQSTAPTAPQPKKAKTFSGVSGIGTGSGSEGNKPGEGNMGQLDGGEDGVYKGTPGSGGGTGRGVGGRGWAVSPNLSQFHQVQETLKLNIYARRDGTITNVKVVGGTLTDPDLISKIIAQVKRGRLNPDPKAPEIELLATWTIKFALD